MNAGQRAMPADPSGDMHWLQAELRKAQARAEAAEELLRAIRDGEVDALVVNGRGSPAVYTLKSAAEPYQLLIEQMAEGALTVSDSGLILYCNSAFARIVGRDRQRLLGTALDDVVVQTPDMGGIMELVRRDQVQHEIELKSPIGPLPALMSSVPVPLDSGHVRGLIISDVSHLGIRLVNEFIISASADGIFALDKHGNIQSWNPAAARLHGYTAEKIIGRSIKTLIPPDLMDKDWDRVRQVLQGGANITIETQIRTKSDSRVDVSESLAAIRCGNGDISGLVAVVRDDTVSRKAEQKVALLMREVNHRSKNLLAVVQAIAHLAARDCDPREFAESFTKRIAALAACHDLLVRSNWEGVEVGELVRAQAGFCDHPSGTRIHAQGPAIRLTPGAAQALGMALHELCTNAMKYGALSVPDGAVRLTWDCAESQLNLIWQEADGPLVRAPRSRGFGSTLIERALKMESGAHVGLEFLPQGVRCGIILPASALAAHEG
ncbi:MAG: PAS domain S-box protein [Alphaproteobacteria bacterium]|nr:PAS domain S-box protein [Alphaproteobacteria bacterium]